MERPTRVKWVAFARLVLAGLIVALLGVFKYTLEWFYVLYALSTITALAWASTFVRASNMLAPRHARSRVLSVVIVAAALRILLGLCIQSPYSVDRYSYGDFQTFLLQHLAPYKDFFFTYPQGAALLFKVTAWMPARNAAWHWLTASVDVLNAYLVMVVCSRRLGEARGWVCAMLYAVLPVMIIESAVNAHLETYVVLFLLLTLLAFLTQPGAAGGLITVAGLIKGWPVALIPLVIAGLRTAKYRLIAVITAIGAIIICTAPFLSAGVAMLRFWYTLLPVPGAGGMSNEITAVVFAQNSLRSAANDIAWLASAPLAAEVALVVIFVVAIADLAIAGDSVLTIHVDRQNRNTGRAYLSRASSFAVLLAALCLATVGISLILQPWLPSQYAYSWWTPTTVEVIRGLTCFLASLCIALLAVSRHDVATDAFEKFVRYSISIAVMIVLIHANNFGWYLLPALVLSFVVRADALRWTLIVAICAFYVSYPSTSFATVLSSRTLATAGPMSVQRAAAPDLTSNKGTVLRLEQNLYRVALPRDTSGFVIADYAPLCKDATPVTARIGTATPLQTVAYGSRAVFPLGKSSAVVRFAGACAPIRVSAVNAERQAISVSTEPSAIRVRFAKPGPAARWWLPYAYITLPLHAQTDADTALTVDQRANYDPTFGGGDISLSVWVDGKDAQGNDVKNLPVVLNDRNASRDYTIRNRYHFRNLGVRLAEVNSVHIETSLARVAAHNAQLSLSTPSVVEEPQSTGQGFAIISAATVLIAWFLIWLLDVRIRAYPADVSLPDTA